MTISGVKGQVVLVTTVRGLGGLTAPPIVNLHSRFASFLFTITVFGVPFEFRSYCYAFVDTNIGFSSVRLSVPLSSCVIRPFIESDAHSCRDIPQSVCPFVATLSQQRDSLSSAFVFNTHWGCHHFRCRDRWPIEGKRHVVSSVRFAPLVMNYDNL